MLKLILVGVLLAGSSSFVATSAPTLLAPSTALRFVDDPPPEPLECPFCGGNPELHRVRIQALERFCAEMALVATRAF